MLPESTQRSCYLAIGSPLQFTWWPAEALESLYGNTGAGGASCCGCRIFGGLP